MIEFFNNPSNLLLIAFIVLVAMLAKPITQIVNELLDERHKKIKQDLDRADELLEQVEALVASTKIRKENVDAEVEAILEHARLEADRMRSEANSAVEKLILNQEIMADDVIHRMESEAEKSISSKIVKLAVQIAEEYIKSDLTPDQKKSINDKIISDVMADVTSSSPLFYAKKDTGVKKLHKSGNQ